MKGLSILIPEYNDDCVEQVKMLKDQCMRLAKEKATLSFPWEIIVADDASTGEFINTNEVIGIMDGCRFIKRSKNSGRSCMRNFLAREAKYDTLLYIDSGLKPNPHFVENYVENIGKSLVVCGNIAVDKECINMGNLRCKNELKAQKRFTADKHTREPYKNFHTTAFMIDRQTMLANPFREDIKTYGYEDTLFGKQLDDKHISISHIDNPVLFVRFESNERYLEKTKEAVCTLYNYREELEDYSPLLHLVLKLKKFHILWLPRLISRFLNDKIVDNLNGNHPNLKAFAMYRICLLADKLG